MIASLNEQNERPEILFLPRCCLNIGQRDGTGCCISDNAVNDLLFCFTCLDVTFREGKHVSWEVICYVLFTIVAGRAASIQFSWGSTVRINEEQNQGLVVSFNDKWTCNQVLIAPFASPTDGKGFMVNMGVPFFNFCQATVFSLNGFPSLGFLLHENQP